MSIDLHIVATIYLTKKTLVFSFPAGTSRGVLTSKESYYINMVGMNGAVGVGECSIIKGLSADDRDDYIQKLIFFIENFKSVKNIYEDFLEFPSIVFGIETAYLDLINGGKQIIYPSSFTQGAAMIPINGLIWMESENKMWEQAIQKMEQGYDCLKIKIGAIEWDKEKALIQRIRKEGDPSLILRVDANGAFEYQKGLEVCLQLKELNIHSIEQPIKTADVKEYAAFCKTAAIPVALDEQLIGVFDTEAKVQLLKEIQPSYIVLKPSLHGGFKGCQEWIQIANSLNIGWWITSALESNIGLNAIAQWTATLQSKLHQGLGTGKIYDNNTPSNLYIQKGNLYFKNLSEHSDIN